MEFTDEFFKALRKASRTYHKGMKMGGFDGPKQGKKKLYSRKAKHKKKEKDEH